MPLDSGLPHNEQRDGLRARHIRAQGPARGTEKLTEKHVVRALAKELDHEFSNKMQGLKAIPFTQTVERFVRAQFDAERAERISRGTIDIAERFTMPDIKHVVPEAREIAMDSIDTNDALEMRELWGTHTYMPNESVDDDFRALLISCRGLLAIERRPDLYGVSRKSTTRRSATS